MQTELFIAFVLIFTIDSLVPGPAVVMVMAHSASVGIVRTLPLIAGLVVGDLVLFALAVLGLLALVEALGPLFVIVKWLGVAYLLYLAYTMWRAGDDRPTVDADAVSEHVAGSRGFLLATLLPLGNPKAVGFYIALLPAFMDVASLTMGTALSFAIAIAFIWTSVLVGYAVLAERIRARWSGRSARRYLDRTCAGAMAATAATVALRE